MRGNFRGSCLKQDEFLNTTGGVLNIYIVYELDSNFNNFDPALENCLLGAVKLTKNADIDKYKYFEYGIRFDARGTFSFPDGSFANFWS